MMIEWDVAILVHARSLGYSCPCSASDFGSNCSVRSLASRSFSSSFKHSPSIVLSPSVRSPLVRRPTSHRRVR